MNDPNCIRWISLSDKVALGTALTDIDREWFEAHARNCPECSGEAAFWAKLGAVMSAPESLNEPIARTGNPARVRLSQLESRLRSRYGWVLGLAAGVALTLSAAWLLRDRPRPLATGTRSVTARLVAIAGQVDVGSESPRAGALVPRGRSVRTEVGFACIAIGDSITTCLDENSEASLSIDNPMELAVRVTRGRVLARLEKLRDAGTFRVETPRATVTAKGTVFSVGLDVEQGAIVRLHEGHVTLRTASNLVGDLVAPAQAFVRQSIEKREWSEQAAAEDQQLLTLSRLPRSGPWTRLDVTTHPAGASVELDGMRLGQTPVSTWIARVNRLSVTMQGYAPLTELLPREPGEVLGRSFELAAMTPGSEAAEIETRSASAASAAPLSPSALMARAQTLRAQGKYHEAESTYRQLRASFPKSDEARVSLVSLGELELSELSQPARALQSFDAYLRAGGPLTREARYGRIRALQLLGRDALLQTAIAEFIRDYPNSVQAASLRKRAQGKP